MTSKLSRPSGARAASRAAIAPDRPAVPAPAAVPPRVGATVPPRVGATVPPAPARAGRRVVGEPRKVAAAVRARVPDPASAEAAAQAPDFRLAIAQSPAGAADGAARRALRDGHVEAAGAATPRDPRLIDAWPLCAAVPSTTGH